MRTLHKVKLYDVSPVAYPAYPQTDVAMRSLEAVFARARAGSYRPSIAALRRRLELEAL